MKFKTAHMETTDSDYLHWAPVNLIMQAAFDNFLLNKGIHSKHFNAFHSKQ